MSDASVPRSSHELDTHGDPNSAHGGAESSAAALMDPSVSFAFNALR